jgi:hypothetical protein
MAEHDARLADRARIMDLMARYAQAVDRRDWEGVRATYHADAHDDHGEFKGGVDAFIDWVSRRHEKVEQSMHFLGNCLVEFTGPDTALVETYFIARQTYAADAAAARTMVAGGGAPGRLEAEIWGRYVDVAERRDGEWRTARRTVVFEVMQVHPASSLPLGADWAQQHRDPSDPLYAMRALAVERAEDGAD